MASRARTNSVGLSDLPEELLLHIFTCLADLGPCYEGQEDPWFISRLPFKNQERDDQPHPGLRAYPFLGQVCKKWERLLRQPIAQQMLWKTLVVDFGHELVTAIHTPLKWSNRRPSAEDFTQALNITTLSVNKILDFVQERKQTIRSLCLCNSEGFWGDEGEYLSLTSKHNFQASHLGYTLGILADNLLELQLFNCNDLLNQDVGVWTLVTRCKQLKTLVVEGINCRIAANTVAPLGALTKLECLTITSEDHHLGQWITGLDGLPQSWSQLTSLKSLTLRGHQLLDSLPAWLGNLPSLSKLDISNNSNLTLTNLTSITQLSCLCLQNLELSQLPAGGELVSAAAKRILPDLTPMAKTLTALSLANNRLTRLPAFLSKLTALSILDVSGNKELVIPAPLTSLVTALPALAICDFRGIHSEKNDYWSEDKCNTMKHLATAAKQLKRRRHMTRFMLDTQ